MTLGVIIICYNIPSEVFLLQVGAIKKFCKDDFTIEVIDNSSNQEMAEHIRYHCMIIGIEYVRTFAGSNNSSDSHSFAANFAYDRFKDKYECLAFIDHDVIPVKDFSASEILKGGHVLAGIGQGAKKKYLWPGILFIYVAAIEKDIIDFSPSIEFSLDTGGNLWKAIEKYGHEACVFFNESYHQNSEYNGKSYNHYAMIFDLTFMHFVNSSNWNPQPDNQNRLNTLVGIAKQKTGL